MRFSNGRRTWFRGDSGAGKNGGQRDAFAGGNRAKPEANARENHGPNVVNARTYHLNPYALVFIGGALGATTRAVMDALVSGGFRLFTGPAITLMQVETPLATSTVLVNVVGAFLMGVLTGLWARKRGNNPSWDRIKLLAGTGFLGAFTTYSSFALALAREVSQGAAFSAVIQGGLVLLLGYVAVFSGMFIGQLGQGTARPQKQAGGPGGCKKPGRSQKQAGESGDTGRSGRPRNSEGSCDSEGESESGGVA
ncbi:CrcB family protein [Gleimia hominis]|uniref:Fluoride-specific ion channel FluC n=1 Tax=Gleimia hominis TaxID=595468 RepID=A0ABU3I8F9_9ACTO|nr:CrcB family protein [Gleimia hominis]MDT3766661.1 CrcB family protein [Gleimia hominis]